MIHSLESGAIDPDALRAELEVVIWKIMPLEEQIQEQNVLALSWAGKSAISREVQSCLREDIEALGAVMKRWLD